MQQTLSITITGKVQGVYFRQSAKEKALDLRLTGQVKNLRDGNVHIIASGLKFYQAHNFFQVMLIY